MKQDISELIERAVSEDIGLSDITSEACISEDTVISGKILLKQSACIAGLPFFKDVFQRVDPTIEVVFFEEDGEYLTAGAILGKVKGHARGILGADRTALNVLQHASGVATVTYEFVEAVEGYQCDILDTRRTLPGLRSLEKYAVRTAGGVNHRYSLDDRFVIKRNHLALIGQNTRYPIAEAVKLAREYRSDIEIEVEVQNLDMVKEALEADVDFIILDHMTIPVICKAVDVIDGKAYVEATGDITLDTIRAYAATGVNGISVGALTYSVPSIDMRLRF
jgi:nicotinate-nucleotide pyrophosphorylase (carboxylating)